MKPANFPARKLARRLRAIGQVTTSARYGYPATKSDRDAALANTLARIVPHDDARAIRTKKDRCTTARFSR